MTPVRVGLVGFGLAGEVFHAPLIAAIPDLSLVSIVTTHPERVARARAGYPGARILPEVASLWGSAADHDLVVVATPNRVHVPIALAAMEAGLHVVVDKPVAPSAAEGHRIATAAADRGLVLTVFQNRRLDGDFLTLKRLIAEGALGRVTRFESRFERWRPQVRAGAWRELGAPEEAGGLLFDLGSHLVDQAIQLFGSPTHVYAEVERRREGAQADDDAFVALRHGNGTVSHLWMSHVAGSLGPRYRVLGLAGAFEKLALDPQEQQLVDGIRPGDPRYGLEPEELWGELARGEEERRRVATERGAYQRFYEGVAKAIRDGAAPPVPPEEAILTIQVLESARDSSASRRVVEFPGAA